MPNNEDKKPLEQFYDSLYVVTKAYFNAGTRLKSLKVWSELSLATLSLFVIMVSLCNAYDMALGFNSQLLDFISVVSAIFVLVYSILVSSRNYGVRSERMHQCGLKMNDLLRQTRLLVSVPENHTSELYEELTKTYTSILDRYDNFDEVDYLHGKMKKWPEEDTKYNKALYFICSRKAVVIYAFGLFGPLIATSFFLWSLFTVYS